MRTALLLATLLPLPLFAGPTRLLLLGDPASEAEHEVFAENTETVSGTHPAVWIMSVRASAQLPPGLPTAAIDGDSATAWRVSGPPQAPMERGNWIEFDLSRPTRLDAISVHWLGSRPYAFKVYEETFSGGQRLLATGTSRGQDADSEQIRLSPAAQTRSLRIEFATAPGNPVQGIREVQLGDLPFPAAYPPAAAKDAPVDIVLRPTHVEPERLVAWPAFNPKIMHADGGTARRIMPRADAFEGGHIDFTLAVAPRETNWITLRVWETRSQSMTARGDLVVLQTLDGDVSQANRVFLPEIVAERQNTEQEWHGPRPQPGRWSYVHFRLPADLVGKRKTLRLRLQGVGNVRRDYPMRAATPPIYSVGSAGSPVSE